MIERLGMILFTCVALVSVLVTGFLGYALWPYVHMIGTAVFVFVCCIMLLILVEIFGFVKHSWIRWNIKARVIAAEGVLAYVGKDKIQHISAIKESAGISTLMLEHEGSIKAQKSDMVKMYEDGISPKEIAQSMHKGIDKVNEILRLNGKRV